MYETLLLTTTGEDAGTITLKSKDYALDEVIVKGERPLVKVEEGNYRMICHNSPHIEL